MMAILIAVVISTAASAGISFMLVQHALDAAAHKAEASAEGDAAPAAKPKDPPNYVPLDPAFVVNLEADDTRVLQVQVQLMTRDPHAVDILKDRKSVVLGKRVSVRVDLGGCRIIKKKKHK